jgi:phosphohistidine swiveling domain-containing protein
MTIADKTMTTHTPWQAPGPGLWQRDVTHFPDPVTRFNTEFLTEFFNSIGMREGFRNYGLVLDHFDVRLVGGRLYSRPRSVGVPEKASSPPPKFIFKLLFLLHPEMRYRKKRAVEVFATRLWREDRARWRNELAPKLRQRNLELQQIDLATLDDTALRLQVEATRQACFESWRIHFLLLPADWIPVGDWLRHTCEWTGVTPAEAMMVLKGKAQGGVAPLALLDQLADAVRSVEASSEILRYGSLDAHNRLRRLRASDPGVARALDTYLNEYGFRLVTGFDLCDLTLRELPHVLLRSIAAQIDKRTTPQEEAALRLRNRVHAAARAEYDSLLEEACAAYGLEDENVGMTALWPGGLMRRALLAAGERLVSRGIVKRPEHLLDATSAEVAALLGGPGTAPSGDDLARRAEERRLLNLEELPVELGEPEAPLPAELLPPACARAMLGLMFYTTHFGADAAGRPQATKETLGGHGVSGGRYTGRARIVRSAADFEKIESGDVLVTRITSSGYNVLLPLLGAVVTDRGGALCHTAIIAREFGIPAVVGTGDATSRIPDGARIVVDGDRGVVEILA